MGSMDGGASAGGGGGSPAPFLLKTYEMVDDSKTDAIVSWSVSNKSFTVWDPPEFARVLLPTYFKHNNFASFIRQLNTYGFRKIDPERWEFANDDFMKDHQHLLKNIHRRKPIHSHSQPPVSIDPERAAYEEEVDKLAHEKGVLEGKILKYLEQESATKAQLEILIHRVSSIEQRQEKLLAFMDKALQNPDFVTELALKLESMNFSAYKKKRRILHLENAEAAPEDPVIGYRSSSLSELGDSSQQNLSSILRLELLPAVSDVNLISSIVISPNDNEASTGWRRESVSKDAHAKGAAFFRASELSDHGASFNLNANSPSPGRLGSDSPVLHSIQSSASIDAGGDDHLSHLLDLTLASSSVELSRSQKPVESTQPSEDMFAVARLDSNADASGDEGPSQDSAVDNTPTLFASCDAPSSDPPALATVSARVNDVFWEQFLTERPGCSDNEEANFSHLTNYNSRMERLTL